MADEKSKTLIKTLCNIFCLINAVLLVAIFGITLASLIVSSSLKSKFDDLDFTTTKIPAKYAPRYDQPHTIQGNRGTCWAHAVVAGLAHSYRRNGIKKGYLTGSQYVPFSVQAFSIMMIRYCQLAKYNESVCRELQAGPEINSTEGGEVAWLYYIPEMYDKLFPLSLCPYIDDNTETSQENPDIYHTNTTEWKCDNLADQINTTDGSTKNPIRFNVTGMTTTFTTADTKKMLLKTELAAPITIDVWQNTYYIPCNTSASSSNLSYSYLCSDDTSELVSCPADVTKNDPSDMCLSLTQPGYNMDGEWYQNNAYTIAGGHGMVIQGYNDIYVSKHGDKGGFPIKNSWYDIVYDPTGSRGGRASHSLQYLMSEISEQEERFICPNAHNPDNWLSCTEYSDQTDASDIPSVNWCVKNASLMFDEVKWNRRPMAFRDYNYQDGDNSTLTYYLDYYYYNPDGTVTAQMIAVPTNATDDSERTAVLINQVPQSYFAWYFQPVTEQADILENDDDNCGLYWLPYNTNQNTARDQDAWYATFYDIDWQDSSYLVNKASYPKYDYQYLEASQTNRKTWSWLGPIARAAPSESNPDVDSSSSS